MREYGQEITGLHVLLLNFCCSDNRYFRITEVRISKCLLYSLTYFVLGDVTVNSPNKGHVET